MKMMTKQITTNDGKRSFEWGGNGDRYEDPVFGMVDDMSAEVIWGLMFVVTLKRRISRTVT